CKSHGELVVEEGVGITAIRSACPAVGIADYTGDMTLFRVPGVMTADNLDVSAALTDVRSVCDDKSDPVGAHVSFKVLARRNDTRGARDVALPYFVTVMRGGNVVIAKRVNTVRLHFEDGQARAEAVASGDASIDKKEATLDPAIRARILKKRKAGEADAAIDPLADASVRAAVSKASFEVLVGFQLNEQQLAYNATR
ncbi:MAG TPA: hypothetical protein VN222_06895, partial [Novosphingobium sp.]|nr:hypothetical protein [Novosphingobium sp.]